MDAERLLCADSPSKRRDRESAWFHGPKSAGASADGDWRIRRRQLPRGKGLQKAKVQRFVSEQMLKRGDRVNLPNLARGVSARIIELLAQIGDHPKAERVKLLAMYGAFPEHVIYYIVEAETLEAIEAFLFSWRFQW